MTDEHNLPKATELAALHGVGPRALRIIAETLAERGLAALKDQ